MPTWTLQNYIQRIRQKIDDTGTSDSQRAEEDLTDLVVGGNGARRSFPLSRTLIMATPALVADVNMAGYTSSGFTVTNGIITFTVAPPLSTSYPTPTSLKVLYNWQNFTDSVAYPSAQNFDIDQFINEGFQKLNLNPPSVDTTYTMLTDAQFNVVCLYGAYFGFTELASRYARQVDQNSQGSSSSKSKISANYQAMAKEAYDQAEKERLAIYGPRQGRATVATFRQGRLLPPSAGWTPPR